MRLQLVLLATLMAIATVSASVNDRPDTVVYQHTSDIVDTVVYQHTLDIVDTIAYQTEFKDVSVGDTVVGEHAVTCQPYRFGLGQVAVPAALIATGVAARQFGWFHGLNDVKPHGSPKPHSYMLDDLIQYTPLVGMYGLKLCGVRGMHNIGEVTVLTAMSLALSAGTVYIAKHAINTWRPDGSDNHSFPSGHTATAFMGAELLRLEYREQPWIGVAGYAVATATAAIRVCHNRHWLSDVLAGAGIGILSTHAAYWLYPVVTRAIFPRLYRDNIYIAPGFLVFSF